MLDKDKLLALGLRGLDTDGLHTGGLHAHRLGTGLLDANGAHLLDLRGCLHGKGLHLRCLLNGDGLHLRLLDLELKGLDILFLLGRLLDHKGLSGQVAAVLQALQGGRFDHELLPCAAETLQALER